MPQTETIAPLELIVNRTVNAPRERVFRAWTEAAELDRWFLPDPDYVVKSAVDLRVGGAYSIELHKKDGQVIGAKGVYREIHRPDRLVFTWTAINCGAPTAEDTLVTVEFFEAGDKTQVTLTHQHFPNTDARDRHMRGWDACFNRLQSIF
jgi:uncharacterized protein YndB with AHSA1/START domain